MIEFARIEVWPDGWQNPNRSRRSSPFRASYDRTLRDLKYEGDRLKATRLIVAVDVEPGMLRRDGMLRQDARVRHPGVVVTLDTPDLGSLVYSCDAFYDGWQANLRAVALGLEALRLVERYGIAERGQQYAGFGALPPARPMGPAFTTEGALRYLLEHVDGGDPDGDLQSYLDRPGLVRDLWRRAARDHHPDLGGDAEIFRKLVEARDLLLGA